jgi:hypothetical protein
MPRLSHSVKGQIYWTKVSINTLVSDDHVGVCAFWSGNLACAAREDDVHPYFRIDQYVSPIDSVPHFCLNSYSKRKNRFPVRRKRTRYTWQRVKCVCQRGEEVVRLRVKRLAIAEVLLGMNRGFD